MSSFGSDSDGGKSAGAMLAIGELADRIGVPTHVLRYWETRFPQLRPLQRSGRRRYYRADDVALAERIHHLLHVKGFTVEGARKALSETAAPEPAVSEPNGAAPVERPAPVITPVAVVARTATGVPVEALVRLRQRLAAALG